MDYFIRFGLNSDYLQNDLERGHSFRLYAFFESRESALESDLVEYYGVDPETVAQNNDGRWGFALEGLCGFGPYETLEEAEEDARERRGYNGVEWPMVGIYTGVYVDDADALDGDMFRPETLVKVIDL